MALPLLACIKPGSGIGQPETILADLFHRLRLQPYRSSMLINPVLDLRSQLTVVGQAIGLST